MGQNGSKKAKKGTHIAHSPSSNVPVGQFKSSGAAARVGKRPVVVISICQGKNIKSADYVGKSDTYIKAECGGQVKKTTVFANSSKPVWNTSVRFDDFQARPTQLVLTAMDKDRLSADDAIGSATIDLNACWDEKEPTWRWIELKNADKVVGSLQIKVTAGDVEVATDYSFAQLDYSHILEVQVLSAKNLVKKDQKSGCFVFVNYNTKQYKTKSADGAKPVWDQTVLFFANAEREKQFEVALTVMDHETDSPSDNVGVAYFPVAQAFENEGKAVEYWLPLRQKAETDKDLANVNQEVTGGTRGAIHAKVLLHKREAVQDMFFNKLLAEFDTNGDGKLDKHEIEAMLEALGVEIAESEFEMFWEASDQNKSDELDHEEAMVFLRCVLLHSHDTANRVLSFIVGGVEAVRDNLMTVADPKRDGNSIDVLHRDTGLVVKENIPVYIKVAIKSLFSLRAGRLLTRTNKVISVLNKLSINQGKKYDDPKSVADIPSFIKLYNLNLDEVEKTPSEYKTFNEFFSRGLKPGCRPVADPTNPRVAISPADCRMMVFEDLKQATEIWIKGDQFTFEGVIGSLASDLELVNRLKSGSMVIARLAPQDYHRWHFPVTGTIGRSVAIDGALYTVNPVAINSTVNVYTTNKRVVTELDTNEFGKVILVSVGASMVGSIRFFVEGKGKTFNKGEQHGTFAFGGSTVLLFFEPGRIKFDDDLVANSRRKLETLIRCNSSLGKATQ